MENQLIHTINGINYLLFEIEINKSSADKLKSKIDKHKGIVQSLTKKDSFWNGITAIVKFLIPENEVISFNNSKDML